MFVIDKSFFDINRLNERKEKAYIFYNHLIVTLNLNEKNSNQYPSSISCWQ